MPVIDNLVLSAAEINVRSFGAVGDGVSDDTSAIQSAITAAKTTGGSVVLPTGVFLISDTLEINTQVGLRMQGTAGPYGALGSILKWAGSTSQTMLSIWNSQDVEIDHVGLDGADITGTRAILADSDNVQVTKRLSFHHFFIRNCNVGIQLGTVIGGGTQYQVDSTWIHDFGFTEMIGTSTCILLQTQNASTISIRDGEMQGATYGYRLSRAGYSLIEDVAGGVLTDFIRCDGPREVLSVISCQAESCTNFIHVTADGASSAPLNVIGCVVNPPITLNGLTRLTSIGNHYTSNVEMIADSSTVVSLNDYFTSPTAFVKTGIDTTVYEIQPTGLNLNGDAITKHLTGTASYGFTGLADGASAVTIVTVTGATNGDVCAVSHENIGGSKVLMSATITSANTAFVTILNVSGGSYDLPTGVLRVDAWRH